MWLRTSSLSGFADTAAATILAGLYKLAFNNEERRFDESGSSDLIVCLIPFADSSHNETRLTPISLSVAQTSFAVHCGVPHGTGGITTTAARLIRSRVRVSAHLPLPVNARARLCSLMIIPRRPPHLGLGVDCQETRVQLHAAVAGHIYRNCCRMTLGCEVGRGAERDMGICYALSDS